LKQKEKKKIIFVKFTPKSPLSKMDHQQNGQSQKRPQQNGPRKSGRVPVYLVNIVRKYTNFVYLSTTNILVPIVYRHINANLFI